MELTYREEGCTTESEKKSPECNHHTTLHEKTEIRLDAPGIKSIRELRLHADWPAHKNFLIDRWFEVQCSKCFSVSSAYFRGNYRRHHFSCGYYKDEFTIGFTGNLDDTDKQFCFLNWGFTPVGGQGFWL